MSGTSNLVRETYSSNTQQQSRPKYSQTSWSSGQRSKHQAPQICPTRGRCSSTGPKDNMEPAQVSYQSPPKERSSDMFSRSTSATPLTTKQSTRHYSTA